MPFNTALSGIRAASSDLKITGNNIANASTVGFKSSRAEFGDVYASTVMGAGLSIVGSGVRLQDVAQQFTQGNVSFTENALDMAINGSGFFIVNQDGDQLFTRAGTFGVDDQGYIVTNTDARLQGFPADRNGVISGIQADLQLETGNQPPRQTTLVESLVNLDSREEVLQREGATFTTDGGAIGVAQSGIADATTTTLTTLNPQTPAFDYSAAPANFDITVAGAADPTENGTVTINLNTPVTSVPQLANIINAQIFTSPTPIGAQAVAVDTGGGTFQLQFEAITEGDPSTISVGAFGGSAGAGAPLFLNGGASTPGVPAVDNGYPTQSIDFTDPDGEVTTYTALAGQSAAATASEMNALTGITATASTSATLLAAGYTNTAGNMVLTLNNVQLTADTLADLETEINSYSSTTLPGISATLLGTGDLQITSSVGDDLNLEIASTDAADQVEVVGRGGTVAQVIDAGGGPPAAVVGGTIDIVLDEGYTASNPAPPVIGLFGPFTPTTFQPFTINAFDPNDQGTYNHATSVTIYDSLGNSHTMTQYFVKQPYDPADPTTTPNTWTMYVQIDGQDVGDPDTTLPPPANTQPTRASFVLRFDNNGELDTQLSDPVLISNWDPLDEDGNPNGALGPLNALAGGALPVPEPPTSSNFEIDLDGSSQFGSRFAVNDVDQNGYTTGRLSGVDVDQDGVVFARFTNGESQILGQVALASFNNPQGLQPVGDTMWGENFESGEPNIGTPGTSALGYIQSGAVEESNVDLSEQLVQLIIAQRNFQASAKTIETADQVTQTIINLR